MSKKYKYGLLLLGFVFLALLFELLKNTFTKLGDFRGYVLVGNFVLDKVNIYTDAKINTWPPFFSIVSVPIALPDNFNRYLVRFLWLSGSLLDTWKIIDYRTRLSFGAKAYHLSEFIFCQPAMYNCKIQSSMMLNEQNYHWNECILIVYY